MSLHFRRLTSAEMRQQQPRFRELAASSYSAHVQGLGPEAGARMMANFQSPEFWEALFAAAIAFVCEEGGNLVGMAFLVPSGNPWRFFPAEWAYVRMVGVSPAHQGKGIARRLMEMLIQEAQSLRERTLALHTSSVMHAARHLYERMGFIVHHELEPQGNARYWVYVMELR